MALNVIKAVLADLAKLRDKRVAAMVAAVLVSVLASVVPGIHLTAAEITGGLTVVGLVVSYVEKLNVLKAKATAKAKRAARRQR